MGVTMAWYVEKRVGGGWAVVADPKLDKQDAEYDPWCWFVWRNHTVFGLLGWDPDDAMVPERGKPADASPQVRAALDDEHEFERGFSWATMGEVAEVAVKAGCWWFAELVERSWRAGGADGRIVYCFG